MGIEHTQAWHKTSAIPIDTSSSKLNTYTCSCSSRIWSGWRKKPLAQLNANISGPLKTHLGVLTPHKYQLWHTHTTWQSVLTVAEKAVFKEAHIYHEIWNQTGWGKKQKRILVQHLLYHRVRAVNGIKFRDLLVSHCADDNMYYMCKTLL